MIKTMEMLLFLLIVIAEILLIGEFLTALCYLIVIVWRVHMKGYHIQKAKGMADHFFDTESKTLTAACEPLASVLKLYEDPESEPDGSLMSESLHQRIASCQKNLRKYGMIRRLRFVDVRAEQKKSGQIYRKWDQGGKEWRSCQIGASVLDEFIDKATGKVVHSAYYPSVQISFSSSRRLAEKERQAALQKDKWGRKVIKDDSFYQDKQLEYCPSCGAKLPERLKDVTCPYCGSTVFSDYYDWQLETFEIEPKRLKLRGLIGWIVYLMTSNDTGSRVKKKAKQKIVRFSENDLRKDVYENIIKLESEEDLIDLWLGEIEIRKIIHTEKDTLLKIRVPVHKVTCVRDVHGNMHVDTQKTLLHAGFIRDRYPGRFQKNGAVISEERYCPSCKAPFTPDKDGNCVHCGAFLFKENNKWNFVH